MKLALCLLVVLAAVIDFNHASDDYHERVRECERNCPEEDTLPTNNKICTKRTPGNWYMNICEKNCSEGNKTEILECTEPFAACWNANCTVEERDTNNIFCLKGTKRMILKGGCEAKCIAHTEKELDFKPDEFQIERCKE